MELEEDYTNGPRIASSWEVAPDGSSITYHLKPWLWEDGLPLTAQDVANSLELFQNSEVGSPRARTYEPIREVVAIDDSTLIYYFSHLVADPLASTAHAILPLHLVRNLDPANVMNWPLNQKPLSSGPFKLESYSPDQSVVLVRNELYPGIQARLDRVVFRFVRDPSARVLGLLAGDLDFVTNVSPLNLSRLEKESSVRLIQYGGRRLHYLVWNCADPRLADAQTRRALDLALDRQRLIDSLLLGYGDLATTIINPECWNFDSSLQSPVRDPHAARELLEAAGWFDHDRDGCLERNGQSLEFEILTRGSDPVRREGAVILKENLEEIGARVSIVPMEMAVEMGRLRKGEFEAYFGVLLTNLYGDPSSIISTEGWERWNWG